MVFSIVVLLIGFPAELLSDLEKQISDPKRYKGLHYQLAEDCLRAALLCREAHRRLLPIKQYNKGNFILCSIHLIV